MSAIYGYGYPRIMQFTWTGKLMRTVPPNAPPAFHLLAKPTGAVCNLDCKYCFFLSKEMLYPGSCFRMADEQRQGRCADEIMNILM